MHLEMEPVVPAVGLNRLAQMLEVFGCAVVLMLARRRHEAEPEVGVLPND